VFQGVNILRSSKAPLISEVSPRMEAESVNEKIYPLPAGQMRWYPEKLVLAKGRASMLEKKGTDYKVYLKSEPQSELRSELEVEVQFLSQGSVFPFIVQIIP